MTLKTLAGIAAALLASGIREGVAARFELNRRLREVSGGAMIALAAVLMLAKRPAA